MKKNNAYIALGILFIVFSAVAFIAPIEKTSTFWISYIFAAVVIAFQIPAGKKAISSPDLKSIFMGWPLLYISLTYLGSQLVASLALMLIPNVPVWVAVIISVILLGLACVGVLGGNAAHETIDKTEAKVQSKVSYVKSIQSDVEILAVQETDPETKKALQELAQSIRYSDPMSSEILSGLEEQIWSEVQSLSKVQDKKDKIGEIQNLLKQRNIKCKALKA